jgi:LPXTG-site transpeptidase (sortase) family protein
MRKQLGLFITFIVTLVLMCATGLGLIYYVRNTPLTRSAESQSLVQPTQLGTPTVTATTTVNPITVTPITDYGNPIKLGIDKLKINLTVVDGTYVNNEWSLSEDKAHFATMTSKPNGIEGNSLIYGHNTNRVFWKTKDLAEGDILTIETDKGKIIEYSFMSYELVTPTDVSVFQYKGKPRVTLLTCNGWNDKYRKLMYFNLVSVKDIA